MWTLYNFVYYNFSSTTISVALIKDIYIKHEISIRTYNIHRLLHSANINISHKLYCIMNNYPTQKDPINKGISLWIKFCMFLFYFIFLFLLSNQMDKVSCDVFGEYIFFSKFNGANVPILCL